MISAYANVKKNVKALDKLLENNAKLSKHGIYVGIPSENNYVTTASAGSDDARNKRKFGNADIGYINEFGSTANNIPARPFLNPSIAKAAPAISKILSKAINIEDITEAMKYSDMAGLYAVSQVRLWIRDQIGFVPLKESTIKARQSKRKYTTAGDKALLDTGSLNQSITYVIRNDNGHA